MQQRIYIGPLPPAKDYRAYEAVHPGSADRILKMAESEQAHGQEMDREALAADKEIARRGQNYALIATAWLGGLGAALGFAGHDWLGGAFVVSSLVPIVAHFLAHKMPETKTKSKPDQPQQATPPPTNGETWIRISRSARFEGRGKPEDRERGQETAKAPRAMKRISTPVQSADFPYKLPRVRQSIT